MSGFQALPMRPDVADGISKLRRNGLRMVTLTNGATKVADRLLSAAGLREDFEMLLSVEDAGIWKPACGAYEYAAWSCGVRLRQMLLVSVHPWAIAGAAVTGMATALIN